MNERDSEVIAGLLKSAGFTIVDDPKEAQVVILNTCSVRQHAEDKVWSEVGRYKGAKIIGIVGCMAKSLGEAIFERSGDVDFVVGPSDIQKIPEIVNKLCANCGGIYESKIWETGGLERPEEIYHTGYHQDPKHAYVVISEGCSNFCSYCVVPFARGPLRHRKHGKILDEVKEAVGEGVTEITLLGQNVNAYSDGDTDFVKLLGLVNNVPGLTSLSFITSHPKDASARLFAAMAELDKVKKYLHLPVQSGSDRILAAMNRGYSRKNYLELVESYRKILPGAALATDVIVGFPSETDEDFQQTFSLVKEVGFDAAFIFKYSPRPQTKASGMPDDVPKEEKERRHGLVLELQKEISRKKKCAK